MDALPESPNGDLPSDLLHVDDLVAQEVETRIKYSGYILRQATQVQRSAKMEATHIPEDLDVSAIPGLRTEARQKLLLIRPLTIGQASRIPGVTPADIAILMVHTARSRRRNRHIESPL